jgi:cutinase
LALPAAAAARTTAGTAPAGASCYAVDLLGARGSGQPATSYGGLGLEVALVEQELQAHLDAAHVLVGAAGVNYPADAVSVLAPSAKEVELSLIAPHRAINDWKKNHLDVYLASVNTGVAHTVSAVKSEVARCPNSLLVLAGYSQGAMVVHQAEHELAASDRSALGHVAGTVLVADGDRFPNTAAKRFGSSPAHAEGLRPRLGLISPRDVPLPATTVDICNNHDIVCDFSINFKTFVEGVKIHKAYPDGRLLSEGAAWVAEEILRNHPGI